MTSLSKRSCSSSPTRSARSIFESRPRQQPGELDEQDNVRIAQTSVLDASINVLYVDGYPRWEYRYIKNEMIRDKTVNISCLLTSADPTLRPGRRRSDPHQRAG